MAEPLRLAHHAKTSGDDKLSPQGRMALYRHAWVVYGKAQLAQTRAALQQPAPNPLASESAAAFMARVAQAQIHTCPKCRGPLQVIQTLPGLRRLTAPGADITTAHMLARAPP